MASLCSPFSLCFEKKQFCRLCVVFEAVGPSNVRLPAASGPSRFIAHFRVPVFRNTTKIPRKDPWRGENFPAGEGKKKSEILGRVVDQRWVSGMVQDFDRFRVVVDGSPTLQWTAVRNRRLWRANEDGPAPARTHPLGIGAPGSRARGSFPSCSVGWNKHGDSGGVPCSHVPLRSLLLFWNSNVHVARMVRVPPLMKWTLGLA